MRSWSWSFRSSVSTSAGEAWAKAGAASGGCACCVDAGAPQPEIATTIGTCKQIMASDRTHGIVLSSPKILLVITPFDGNSVNIIAGQLYLEVDDKSTGKHERILQLRVGVRVDEVLKRRLDIDPTIHLRDVVELDAVLVVLGMLRAVG